MVTIKVIPIDIKVIKTKNVLNTNDNDWKIKTLYNIIAIISDYIFDINNIKPFTTEILYEKYNRASLKAVEQQGINQTYSAFDTGYYDEEAEFSRRTFAFTILYIIIISITDKKVRLFKI